MNNQFNPFWQAAFQQGGLCFMQMQEPEPENVVLAAEAEVIEDGPAIEDKHEQH